MRRKLEERAIEHLRADPDCGCELCERAAILEYDAHLRLSDAESRAARETVAELLGERPWVTR
mgnify:CR=1 FL=1